MPRTLNLPEALLSELLDNLSQGILLIDLNGTLIFANASLCIILGEELSNLAQASWWSLFPDQYLGFSLKQALAEKNPPPYVHTAFINHLRIERKIDLFTSPWMEEGVLKGYSIVLCDVTEWERLKEEEKRGDRLRELGKFASIVAHEVRNPLGAIEGFAELLAQDLDELPKQKKMAESILSAAHKLNHFVSDTLQMVREPRIQKISQDLATYLHKFCEKLQNECTDCGVTLQLHTPPHVEIPFDADLFERALWNICRNSIEAMEESTQKQLQVKLTENDLTIQDSGCGISPEMMSQLFRPFVTTKPSGTGLGLTEVDKVVRAHGWKMHIASEPGSGVKITISFQRKLTL